MEFTFKETVWASVSVPEEIEQDVLDSIKNGEVTTAEDIFQQFPTEGLEYDTIDNTSEQMSVEENDNQSTIEVMEIVDQGKGFGKDIIWSNEPEEKEILLGDVYKRYEKETGYPAMVECEIDGELDDAHTIGFVHWLVANFYK